MGRVDFSFRERALAEAARYGPDSWVFLRELLQNARDAGARRIDFTVSEEDHLERIVCRDDGCGMSAVHAHRYLFALYASSKEGDARQAGQFGVGFWSVLRFRPERVVIRSRASRGEAWQVELNQRLENAVFTACDLKIGTEIVLERRRQKSGRDLAKLGERRRRSLVDRVFAAVYRYGRFLERPLEGRSFLERTRKVPLQITVNGRPAYAEMTLPPPSSSFRRPGFRGVVALGAEPKVELFANGLFVREAACLEDLVEEGGTGEREDGRSSLDLPGSLAPQILLESSELEVLLARSDVRQTRHLNRMVKTAEKELERLIERQLEAVRPQPWYLSLTRRLLEAGAELLPVRRALRKARWLAPAALLGVFAAWGLLLGLGEMPGGAGDLTYLDWSEAVSDRFAFGGRDPERIFGYEDLGESYLGPVIDPQVSSSARVAISYEPPALELHLTALVVEDPSTWSARKNRRAVSVDTYQGIACPRRSLGACVEIRLNTEGGETLRIPVPTGHRLDPDSVLLNGEPRPVFRTASGEPILRGVGREDRIRYRTGPAAIDERDRPPPIESPPAALISIAQQISGASLEQKVEEAAAKVAERIVYDRSITAAREHRLAQEKGQSFAAAALAVGRGDCDVQNGVLVLLLREAGVNARLAVGYVTRNGQAGAGLHAWVEYLDAERRWRVADVSTRFSQDAAASFPLYWVRGGGQGPGDAESSDALSERRNPRLEGLRWQNWADWVQLSTAEPWMPLGPLAAFAGLALAWALWTYSKRSPSASLRLAETDLAALLGGALQHPGLARMPALVHGRFIPLICGAGEAGDKTGSHARAISLSEGRRCAERGMLFSSLSRSPLARSAAARGLTVIDAGQAEGAVAIQGLGAIDLDEWSELLELGTSSGLVRSLNSYLESIGEKWRLALASPLSQPVRIVDLERLGLGRRLVLIDPSTADFLAAGASPDTASSTAAFRLLDRLAEHLGLARHDRARLLTELARRAVLEKGRA